MKLKDEYSNRRSLNKKLSKMLTMHYFPEMKIILSACIMDMRTRPFCESEMYQTHGLHIS